MSQVSPVNTPVPYAVRVQAKHRMHMTIPLRLEMDVDMMCAQRLSSLEALTLSLSHASAHVSQETARAPHQ